MSFLALVLKNIVRHRVRSALTVLGIGVGITTVVALGVIVSGAKAMAADYVELGGADFMVAQNGAADLTFSTVPVRVWHELERRPDVERATGVLMHFTRVGENPFFGLFGVSPDGIAEQAPPLLAGRQPETGDELMLGARAAQQLGIGVGATIEVAGKQFRVSGVYRSGSLVENSGAYAWLETVQQLAGREDAVTVVYIVARGDPARVAAAIERDAETLAAIAGPDDWGKVDQGMAMIDALNLAISLLAVGIGAIGVMNTMIMSVFERTRELGIMRALGWRRRRVLRMIFSESLALCAVATAFGVVVGWLAVRALLLVPTISNFVEPVYGIEIFARAIAVAVGVALIGAAYPAVRAIRLSPMEALRYE